MVPHFSTRVATRLAQRTTATAQLPLTSAGLPTRAALSTARERQCTHASVAVELDHTLAVLLAPLALFFLLSLLFLAPATATATAAAFSTALLIFAPRPPTPM